VSFASWIEASKPPPQKYQLLPDWHNSWWMVPVEHMAEAIEILDNPGLQELPRWLKAVSPAGFTFENPKEV
jgi:hypothetical protein